MGRKHTNDDGASLDLLLDTITNALGGILFLAILLVLLTKASRAMNADAKYVPVGEIDSLRQELAAANERQRELQQQAELAASLNQSLIDPDADKELQSLLQDRSELDRLLQERRRVSQQVAVAKADLAAGTEAEREQNVQFAEVSQRLNEIKRRLESEQSERRVDLPLPQERAATTEPFNVAVRYGRLYFMREKRPADPRDVNFDDFIDLGIGVEGGIVGDRYRQVTPKPWAGLPILEGEAVSPQTRSAILLWPADKYYSTIVVWDDSYEAMQRLRSFLVERGYRYRLIPITDGEAAYEGATANARVQ